MVFGRKQPAREALYAPGPAWYAFLLGKWYFDEALRRGVREADSRTGPRGCRRRQATDGR